MPERVIEGDCRAALAAMPEPDDVPGQLELFG